MLFGLKVRLALWKLGADPRRCRLPHSIEPAKRRFPDASPEEIALEILSLKEPGCGETFDPAVIRSWIRRGRIIPEMEPARSSLSVIGFIV